MSGEYGGPPRLDQTLTRASLGVQKGDRVALWSQNRAECAEVLFGVPMPGAIAAPLDFWWTWKDAYAGVLRSWQQPSASLLPVVKQVERH
ncbi:MAG: AMP-binding protein [Gammaproteobacteria bacterium]